MKCPKCQHENPDATKYCGECATPLHSADQEFVTKTIITPAKKFIKGSTIAGKYRILDELGRGGMGVVYKAEDSKLKRTVALKFLPPELTHTPDIKERFMREAQSAAALDHPNICTVYEFDDAEDTSFISMAYIEGQTLKRKLDSGPLELDEALRIATQVAEGLQEAHKKGIIHRDIKSSNIMVTGDGQAKIMDFGLARKSGGTLITKEGSTMGTVAYMSPEQAQGNEVDHRTDIWSFGVVLYEMFTGQLPFKGGHDQGIVYSILKETPKLVSELRSEVPVSLAQVVAKTLEKNPDDRYQQIAELLDDLKSISAGIIPDEIKLRLRKATLRKRKKAILFASSAGLVIILALIALSLLPGRAEAISSIAVLPFENRTGDEGKEYFVDGATDEVITQLGKIGAWRVISRTSAMHYKRAVKSLSEIAGELNVDAVVEGTVYQIGENVRIGVRLIDVLPEEKNLWADIYDRPKTDVRIIYSEMARTIADKTQVNLTAEEITRLTSASQVNSESYDNYLKGRSHWLRFTSAEFKLALQYFDLALQIDPNNSLAHLGVAQVWGSRYQVGYATRDEAYPILNSSAQKALELDNTLAEAHYWLAGIRGWGEWDWKGAETGFLQAFKLNPNFPDVYAWYSHLLSHLGRADEALSYIGRALELDPLNPTFQALYGVVLIYNRRFDEAITAARKVLEMEPLHPIAQGAMHWALLANGKYEELLAYYREKRYANRPKWVAALDVGFEKAGYSGAFRTLADMMVEWYKSQARAVKAMGISDKYLEAGDLDLAIDWLEKAYEDHDMSLPYIGIPAYDPLRSDPRFQELLRKMNLPVDEKK